MQDARVGLDALPAVQLVLTRVRTAGEDLLELGVRLRETAVAALGELLSAVEHLERLELDEAWSRFGGAGIIQQSVLDAQRRAFGWKRGA